MMKTQHHLQCHQNTSKQGGFAYLSVLIAIAIIGISAAATQQLGSILQRRAAEEELLAVGREFQQALLSYNRATPVGQPTSPQSLEVLLKDPRYPNTKRHLRKLYFDPLTGKQEWGTLLGIDGKSIVGIYSLSLAKPIKTRNFDMEFQNFEGKTKYSEWIFTTQTSILLNRFYTVPPLTPR